MFISDFHGQKFIWVWLNFRGHGTSELNGEVVATVCGVVERVNKLVYVRALRARYKPEVGDIIVGRVVEVIVIHTTPFFVLWCSCSPYLKMSLFILYIYTHTDMVVIYEITLSCSL